MLSHNEHTEYVHNFLSALLIDPEFILETRITGDMLSLGQGGHGIYAMLFNLIRDQVGSGIKVNFKTVWDGISLKAREDNTVDEAAAKRSLTDLSNGAISSANWKHYEDLLLDYSAQIKISAICHRVLELDGPSITAKDKAEMLESVLSEIQGIENESNIVTMRETITPIIAEIERRYKMKGDLIGIRTGITELDNAIYGFQESQLVVIGARPSEGKSALMNQIKRHMAIHEKVSVGVITIESSINEIGFRDFAAEGPMNASSLSTGYLSASDFSTLKDAASVMYDAGERVLYYDKPGIELSEVRQVARRMKRKYGIRVLFIDYLQLIDIPDPKLNGFQIVSKVSKGLKQIARQLKICVVSLAQLGRDSEGRRPGLKDFQSSSSIEQDADVALMLWHPVNDKGEIESMIVIGKARDGTTNDIPVYFDKPHMTFKPRSMG